MGGLLSPGPKCPHAGPEGPGELVVVSGRNPWEGWRFRRRVAHPCGGKVGWAGPHLAGRVLPCPSCSPPGAQNGVLSE